jgi:hypothetical protein
MPACNTAANPVLIPPNKSKTLTPCSRYRQTIGVQGCMDDQVSTSTVFPRYVSYWSKGRFPSFSHIIIRYTLEVGRVKIILTSIPTMCVLGQWGRNRPHYIVAIAYCSSTVGLSTWSSPSNLPARSSVRVQQMRPRWKPHLSFYS